MRRPPFEVSFLRMDQNPMREKHDLNILKARDFPSWYFLALYGEAGRPYYWLDQLEKPRAEVDEYCADPTRTLYTLMDENIPAGFFILSEEGTNTELSYFGLMADAVGKGFGGKFLDYAIATAWEREAINSMTVDTCTLDHPRALPLYLSRGFVITRKEAREALY